MKNVHITLTEFRHETRIVKEIESLRSAGFFEKFVVVGLANMGLPNSEISEDGTKIIRISLKTKKLPKRGLFQLIKYGEFIIKCLKLTFREKPTVVNVHTLELLPLGWIIKTISRAKLVYDAHELESERNGLEGIRKQIAKIVEKSFIGHCDMTIVVGDKIADWYAEKYRMNRPVVVKNAPKLRQKKSTNLLREKLSIPLDSKIFLYQGGLMNGRGLNIILEAFSSRRSSDAIMVFMGYGELEEVIKSASKINSNIYFHPAVPPNVLLDYTVSADYGIHLAENVCLSYYYSLPNKFFEYAMAGLPVIVSNMFEMSKVIDAYNFGITIQENSPAALNIAIDKIMLMDYENLSTEAQNFAIENAWEIQEKNLFEGYQNLFKSSK